jgi:hypothetical protein
VSGSVVIGAGLRVSTVSLLISVDTLGISGAGRRANVETLKMVCGRSWEPDLFRGMGGGGKTGFEAGSGDALY